MAGKMRRDMNNPPYPQHGESASDGVALPPLGRPGHHDGARAIGG